MGMKENYNNHKQRVAMWMAHRPTVLVLAALGVVCFVMGRQSKTELMATTSGSRRASTTSAASSSTFLRSTQVNYDNNNNYNSNSYKADLPLCAPLDLNAMGQHMTCPAKCRLPNIYPLTPTEQQSKIELTIETPWSKWHHTYGYHQVHFPEEDVWVRSDVLRAADRDVRPRSITERLFRRIIAKLFKAGVLDPAGNIVNTGSWIGDNAVPWAMMLEQLQPENPGRVYAIDPSQENLEYMMHMAQLNNVGNLCAHAAVFSTEQTTVYAKGEMEHLKISNKPFEGAHTFQSIPMDALQLENVVLLHLDVEGHEGELLAGAKELLRTSRPIVVTEGTMGWPPVKNKDKRVADVLLGEAGYLEETSEIPEICGWDRGDRNRIWWPDAQTRQAALQVIGDDLNRDLVSWLSPQLPPAGGAASSQA